MSIAATPSHSHFACRVVGAVGLDGTGSGVLREDGRSGPLDFMMYAGPCEDSGTRPVSDGGVQSARMVIERSSIRTLQSIK